MDAELAREFFRKYERMIEDMWIETQCYRQLLLEKNLISEDDLEKTIEAAKLNPENQRIAAETFASSRKVLAEFGMQDTLRNLASKPPTTDKQN
jgi:hypothetical protein